MVLEQVLQRKASRTITSPLDQDSEEKNVEEKVHPKDEKYGGYARLNMQKEKKSPAQRQQPHRKSRSISKQDQAHTAETLAEIVQVIKAELSKNWIDQILNDVVNLVATIGVLPSKFAVKVDQLIQLEGDVQAKDAIWATLAEATDTVGKDLEKEKSDNKEEVIRFEKSQLARHLRPLYIKTYIDGRLISQVLIDGGTIMNVMPLEILRNLIKTQSTLKGQI